MPHFICGQTARKRYILKFIFFLMKTGQIVTHYLLGTRTEMLHFIYRPTVPKCYILIIGQRVESATFYFYANGLKKNTFHQ